MSVREAHLPAPIESDRAPSRVMWLIAAFKLFKGLLLLAVGIGALHLVHRDVAAEIERWADLFRVDPGNFFIHRLLSRVATVDDRKLRELSVGTFFYSALLLTEGTGLALHKRWAAYFTIIATSSFLPLEVYELVKGVSLAKGVVLLTNVAIVIYLFLELRREQAAWARG